MEKVDGRERYSLCGGAVKAENYLHHALTGEWLDCVGTYETEKNR